MATETFSVRITVTGAREAKAELERVGDAARQTAQASVQASAQLGRAIEQNVAQGAQRATAVFDQFRQRVQQLQFTRFSQIGYQLQDIAVQMQNATHWTTIFLQQGTQIAAAFGPIAGLIAGIVGVAASVAATFGLWLRPLRDTQSILRELQLDVENFHKTLLPISAEPEKIARKFLELGPVGRAAALLELEERWRKLNEAEKAAMEDARSFLEGLYRERARLDEQIRILRDILKNQTPGMWSEGARWLAEQELPQLEQQRRIISELIPALEQLLAPGELQESIQLPEIPPQYREQLENILKTLHAIRQELERVEQQRRAFQEPIRPPAELERTLEQLGFQAEQERITLKQMAFELTEEEAELQRAILNLRRQGVELGVLEVAKLRDAISALAQIRREQQELRDTERARLAQWREIDQIVERLLARRRSAETQYRVLTGAISPVEAELAEYVRAIEKYGPVPAGVVEDLRRELEAEAAYQRYIEQVQKAQQSEKELKQALARLEQQRAERQRALAVLRGEMTEAEAKLAAILADFSSRDIEVPGGAREELRLLVEDLARLEEEHKRLLELRQAEEALEREIQTQQQKRREAALELAVLQQRANELYGLIAEQEARFIERGIARDDPRLAQLREEIAKTYELRAAIEQIRRAENERERLATAATNILTRGLEQAVFAAQSLKDALAGVLRELAALITRAALFAPLEAAIGAWFKGWIGAFLPVGSAKGNVFAGGELIPFARGGIIDRPVIFPMRRGLGLAGEEGPEAILPLRRLPNGQLGVQASSQPAEVRVRLEITDLRRSGGPIETKTETAADGTVIIRQTIKDLLTAAVSNGALDAILARRYGLAPVGR